MTRPAAAYEGPARAVMVLAVVLAFWNVWAYDLWAPDEPYFGEGAREMVVDGQWVVPHVNGAVTTDKPPLFFWLIALVSLPFGGVGSVTARIPSIAAFAGTVFLTMRLARRWGDERAAAVAGLVLATMYLPWDKGRTAQIDMTLCFFIVAALSVFQAVRAGMPARESKTESPGERARLRRLGWIFWGCLGLAVLAKGPVGLLVPLGIVLAVLIADRRLGLLGRFAPVTGPLLMLAIPGAWILLESVAGPADYSVIDAFRHHVLERGLQGMHHPQPFYYFLYTMPLGLLPWTFFVPGAVWVAWRRKGRAEEPGEWNADRMLIVWFAFVVIFFSIWREKRDLYVLPAYPAVALLVARLVARVAGWGPSSADAEADRTADTERISGAWLLVPAGFAAAMFAGGAVMLPGAVERVVPAAAGMSSPITALCIVLAAGALVVLREAIARRPVRSVLMLGTATSALYLALVTFVYPAANPLKSAAELARRTATETGEFRAAGGRVIAYELGNTIRQIAFYSDGIYPLEVGPGELVRKLNEPSPVWAVVDAARLEELRPRLNGPVREVSRAALAGGDVLLVANEPREPASVPPTP